MSDDGMPSPPPASTAKASVQLNKMREANAKYKSLLKMAKERIQAQEEEIEALRGTQCVLCHFVGASLESPPSLTKKHHILTLL